jgi:NADH-quinone oxidoreductase subunit C
MPDFLSSIAAKCRLAPTLMESTRPQTIRVDAADLLAVMNELYTSPQMYFDMLSCVTGIDNGVAANSMEIVYNLYSIPFNHHVAINVLLPRENAEIESVSAIWKTANWHEREIFDMYGIKFRNHNDLRRILMPADWDGHPLRKDYKHQEYYRDIKVEY